MKNNIKDEIKKTYKKLKIKVDLYKILKRKNSYYLKDDKNKHICKITKTEKNLFIIYIKNKNDWLKKSEGSLENILSVLIEKKEKKTINFTKDEINRLNRGIYRYVDNKCININSKDFEAKIRFGRIYFNFFVDEIFRINIYDKDYKNCSIDKKKKDSEWEEFGKGSFDNVMNYLDTYFKNHYINDEII